MCGTRIQGFRKYLSVAKDHDELLAFLLGHLVREKVRAHQLRTGQGPAKVAVKIEELDDRVCIPVSPARRIYPDFLQAKEHEIYDTNSFLRSKVFQNNGYRLAPGTIEKVFKSGEEEL